MSADNDLIAELTEDHRRIEGLCGLIQSMPWGDPRRRPVVARIAAELAGHARAESRFLYPAVRRRVRGGPELAAVGLGDHTRMGGRVADMAERGSNDARFHTLLTRLVFDVHEHAATQERDLFPRLAETARTGELHALAELLRASRRPTATGRGVVQPEPDPMERLQSGKSSSSS